MNTDSANPTGCPTVAVAMSGGVDSSTAAALCVEGGYDVFGIMLRLWSEPGGLAANRCCTLRAIDDAMMVACALDIPFQVIDAEDVFKRTVVDHFVARSAAGETPNPCFTCNQRMRFGFLLAQARALGADYLATGHYARVAVGPDGAYELLRGADRQKDQSYMLHRLGQAELAHALFPVGHYRKAEVRSVAERFDLPVAGRADSVDLCWVGEGGTAGFLARHLPAGAAAPGPIEDTEGNVVGQHAGLPFYTVGQRHGLGVALGEPVYVQRRESARNALVVGPAGGLLARSVRARRMHWVGGAVPSGPLRVEAQVRYRAAPASATLEVVADGEVEVHFDEPQRAPTPGQGLVAYRGEVCLGGGIIAQRCPA